MKKMWGLYIDTSSRESIRAVIEAGDERFESVASLQGVKAQEVLPMIEGLLKAHSLKLDDLAAIKVNAGPGSFTGLRVGCTVANILSFLLGIRVNSLPEGLYASPSY